MPNIYIRDADGVVWQVTVGTDGLLQTASTSLPSPGGTVIGSLSAQDILDSVSQDIRKQLNNTGTDADILLDYVDRIHKDLVRANHGVWLLSDLLSFTTTEGKTDYYLGTGSAPAGAIDLGFDLDDIDYIEPRSVRDLTNNKVLSETLEKPLADIYDINNKPALWRYDDSQGASILNIYPPGPATAATIEFRYRKKPLTVDSATVILQVPETYKHVFIAGVNELAFIYLKDYNAAQYWAQKYAAGQAQIRRDLNLWDPRQPRPQFIGPDPSCY